MMIKALRKSEPIRLVVGLGIDLTGLAIGASQYLHTHHIF